MTQQGINNTSMLKVGTILRGTYRIDSYLSSGGFGNTYVATNIEFEERVAIKEFFMKGVTQRDDNQTTVSVSNTENSNSFLEQKEKFKKEARRIRQLHNSHIVNVHDLFEENGTAYYVMDYVDGENLAERLKRTGKPMTESEVRLILPQILDALKSVHDEGMWHLDLKPANIMLEKGGNVKLIDFGASKQLNAQKGGATTGTAISYTNGYAPREQMEQNYDKFGPWTDIYALGATLYNLLTNKRPPLPTDIDDDMSEDKHLALPFPEGVGGLRFLVLQMMKTNRLQRPQSIDAIVEAEKLRKEEPKPSPKQQPTLKPSAVYDDEATIIAESQYIKGEKEIRIKQDNKQVSKTESKLETQISTQTSNRTTSQQSDVGQDLGKGCIIVSSIFLFLLIIIGGLIGGLDSCSNGGASNLDTSNEIIENKVVNADGSSYEGEWVNGVPDGYGIYIWPNGDKYEGEWDKGNRIFGTYTWPEKKSNYMYKYVGEFNKNEEFEGYGTAYYNGGDINKGFWKNGQYIGNEQGKRKNIIIRGLGEPFLSGDFKWELISIRLEDNKTIIKKKVTIIDPQSNGSCYIYSTKDEYIEDVVSGEKFYIKSSEIGISPDNSSVIKTRYFNEEYPALPSNVKSINISSGSHYYIKNLNIV